MAAMTTDSPSKLTRREPVATSSWGLGDGQAIPWEYAPAPEVPGHRPAQGALRPLHRRPEVEAADGATFASINPATEEPLARVAKATPPTWTRPSAPPGRHSGRAWGSLAGRERAKYLFRIARILQERSREFAVLESMDTGKPIKESRDVDVPLAAAHFWYYAGWADKLEYAFPGRVAKPLGVAAQIIPWNFPLLMLAWKIAPALAAGNTVVLKPASTTPLSALLFAEVCVQADLPPGVVNIVPGPGEVGMHLVRHPGVDKVAFTGSTEIGKRIAKGVAGTDKALTLELGGKAANIVFDDAPLDQAVEGIVNGIYFNQGEVCCAGSRLLAQESIAEPLIEKLKDRLSTIRVGDPLDKNTDVGAINSKSQLEKITELVEAGRAEGAEMYQPACDLPDRGYFFRPTLFTNVAQSHRIAQEEIFGPVLSVLTFRTPEEAVEKANNTPYGLSAGVWTDKGSRILTMVKRMKAGVVWANTFNRFDPTCRSVATRSRASVARAACTASTPTCDSRTADGGQRQTPPTNAVARRGRTGIAPPSRRRGSRSARRTSSTSVASSRDRSPAARTSSRRRRRAARECVRGSRKDLRDAVRAARQAAPGWADQTAMNRGQVLYRVAELMEGRRDQFAAEVAAAEGVRDARAPSSSSRSIDRWVWYAGWADKIAQVLGSSNPVAAPYFNFTIPEPTGVVGIVAPETSSLLGLVSAASRRPSCRATPSSSSPRRRDRCRRSP